MICSNKVNKEKWWWLRKEDECCLLHPTEMSVLEMNQIYDINARNKNGRLDFFYLLLCYILFSNSTTYLKLEIYFLKYTLNWYLIFFIFSVILHLYWGTVSFLHVFLFNLVLLTVWVKSVNQILTYYKWVDFLKILHIFIIAIIFLKFCTFK